MQSLPPGIQLPGLTDTAALQVMIPLGEKADRRNGRTPKENKEEEGSMHKCVTGETVCVRKPPDKAQLKKDLQGVLKSGIKSLAVVLKHAAIFPDHEKQVGALLLLVQRWAGVCVCT